MNSRREKVFLSPLLKWGRGLRKSDKSSCWLTSENVKRLEIEGEIKHLLGIENSKLAEEGGCGLSASWSVPFPALLNVPDPPFFFPFSWKIFLPWESRFHLIAWCTSMCWRPRRWQWWPSAWSSPGGSAEASSQHLLGNPQSLVLHLISPAIRVLVGSQPQHLSELWCQVSSGPSIWQHVEKRGGCQQPLKGPTVKRQPLSPCPFHIVSPRHCPSRSRLFLTFLQANPEI